MTELASIKPILTLGFDKAIAFGESEAPRRDMLFTKPTMTATNAETEGYRILRLADTWGRACVAVELQSQRYQRQWEGAVLSMRDQKGTLRIIWRDRRSRIMFEGVVMGAWESQGEYSGLHGPALRQNCEFGGLL